MTSGLTRREALKELARRRCTLSLRKFIEFAWPEMNPGVPLVWNWHMSAICQHLEAVTEGRLQRLVINVPPGHSKTSIVSVCWPIWEWLRWPERRWIFGSYELQLSVRDNVNRRNLLTSDRFAEVFAPEWGLDVGGKQKMRFTNSARGSMRAVSVGSGVTGDHADRIVIDDPIKPSDIYGPGLENHVRWFNETVSTRFRDLKSGAFVVIMQRLHQQDLAGTLIERDDVEHLNLMAEFDPERRATTSIGWTDPRSREGQLLFPERFPAEVIAAQKRVLGSAQYAAQYQQTPVAGEGNIFGRTWWKRWRILPAGEGLWLGSWDCTYDEGEDNDYVVGQVWVRHGANVYLVDQVRARMTFTETRQAVRDFAAKWPRCQRWLVERKANGIAILDELKRVVPGLIGTDARTSKAARAAAVSALVEAGNVYLPDDAPWVHDFVEEHAAFPRGAHDDQVDCTSQALRGFGPAVGTAPKKRPPKTSPKDAESGPVVHDRRRWNQRGVRR